MIRSPFLNVFEKKTSDRFRHDRFPPIAASSALDRSVSDLIPLDDSTQPSHRSPIPLASFSAQFNAWTGLVLDAKGKAGNPSGEVARFARDRYLQIKRDVLVLAAGKAAA